MKFDINIPDDANKLIRILQKHGHSAYVVGGCVRDTILGRTPHDWDLCTSATPSEMLQIFADKKIIETGLKHGTVTIMENDTPYEITTYRIDGEYADNRHPNDVTFTDNLSEDLKRRDFTINAMTYNHDDGLIDLFGGLDDIKHQKIQCVGSAKERFQEDALRILRAIRFAAQLGFSIEEKTDYEIYQQYESLKNISMERINSEFCKIIASNNSHTQLDSHKQVFTVCIPEIQKMFFFPQCNPYHIYDVWKHTMHAMAFCDEQKTEDLILKLAVSFHDIGKPYIYQEDEDGTRHFKGHGKVSAEMTDAIMKHLKFDNDTREKVVQLISYHDATFEVGTKYIKRWLNKMDVEQFLRLLELRKADITAQNPAYAPERLFKVTRIETALAEVLSSQSCFSVKNLALNGNDIMQILNIKAGKEIGILLNQMLNLIIDEELENTKEALTNYLILHAK